MRTRSALKRAAPLLGIPLLFPLLFVAARAADPVGTLAIRSQGYFYTGEASFRAQYDHCTAKFLTQAGVKNDHVRLERIGIHGNGHMMMLEKNSLAIAASLDKWLRTKL